MKIHECVSFIVVKDGQILLETRKKDKETDPGMIAIPGGHMEHSETQKQALFRELKEELNIIPQTYTHLCSLYHPTTELQLLHYYVISNWQGEIECLEAESVDWSSPINAPVATEVDRVALRELRRLENTISSILNE